MMKIIEKFSCDVEQDSLFLKDANLSSFQDKFPQLLNLTEQLRKHLSDEYKYYLVDFMVLNCTKGKYTCRDISWHFDGDYEKDNKYVLWVKGPNRTLFPKTNLNLNPPSCRIEQKNYLNNLFSDIETVEVPEETIVSYDSKDPHRGVSCLDEGKRYFFRMMASNYIKPKRISL